MMKFIEKIKLKIYFYNNLLRNVFVILILFNQFCFGQQPSLRVMEAMTAEELIKFYGYPVETHKVVTADGYIITLHRLPQQRQGAPPVLLQHGIMGSTETWVMQGPKKDLPYLMYNAGFDVWIGNSRGSIYGRKHINMTLEDPQFWEFSWHEMGLYDLPAMLDHIIAYTGFPDINYIGHSMGTTMFYVMGSQRPEYNKKIRVSLNMAPVAYMNVNQFVYRQYAKFRTQIKNMLINNKIYELLPMNKALRLLQADLCRDGSIFQWICIDMLFTLTGTDWKQLNRTMVPMYLRHAAPSSIQTLDHYSQLIGNPGTFQAYDYKDPYKNYEKYGFATPPSYNISRITAPVALFYAKNDYLSRPVDVERIARELPNVIGKYLIPYNNFNHIDYLWGENSKKMVYDHLINLLMKYSNVNQNNNNFNNNLQNLNLVNNLLNNNLNNNNLQYNNNNNNLQNNNFNNNNLQHSNFNNNNLLQNNNFNNNNFNTNNLQHNNFNNNNLQHNNFNNNNLQNNNFNTNNLQHNNFNNNNNLQHNNFNNNDYNLRQNNFNGNLQNNNFNNLHNNNNYYSNRIQRSGFPNNNNFQTSNNAHNNVNYLLNNNFQNYNNLNNNHQNYL